MKPNIYSKLILTIFGLLMVLSRAWYILLLHSPRNSIDSDARSYVSTALTFRSGLATQNRSDTIWPPGTSALISSILMFDPTLLLGDFILFSFSISISVAGYLLLKKVYNSWLGLLFIILMFFDFHYLIQFGFFMSEAPFSLMLIITTIAFFRISTSTNLKNKLIYAFASGVLIAISSSIRTVLLPAEILLTLNLIFNYRNFCGEKRSYLLASAFIFGIFIITVPLSYRCTTLNKGVFCLESSNGPANLVMGHAGKYRLFKFTDSTWGPPSRWSHPEYAMTRNIGFSYFDSKNLMLWWFAEVLSDPAQIIKNIQNNFLDLFRGTTWYAPTKLEKILPSLSFIFNWFVFLPSVCFAIFLVIKTIYQKYTLKSVMIDYSLSDSRQYNLISFSSVMLISLFFVFSLVTGEIRYRTPFDVFFFILFCGLLNHLFFQKPPKEISIVSPSVQKPLIFLILTLGLGFSLLFFSMPNVAFRPRLLSHLIKSEPIYYGRRIILKQLKIYSNDIYLVQNPINESLHCELGCEELFFVVPYFDAMKTIQLKTGSGDYYRATFYCANFIHNEYLNPTSNSEGLREFEIPNILKDKNCFGVGLAPLYGDGEYKISEIALHKQT